MRVIIKQRVNEFTDEHENIRNELLRSWQSYMLR